MAVYTEIPDDELDAFMTSYDVGAVLSCKGIAEGVENSNFLVVTEAGQFILTLYEKRVAAGRPALLPRPDGASGGQGHHLPDAGPRPRRAWRSSGSPAGRRRW